MTGGTTWGTGSGNRDYQERGPYEKGVHRSIRERSKVETSIRLVRKF